MSHTNRVGLVDENLQFITDTNPLQTRSFYNGHVCDENTTVTPLLASAVFTGDWQDTLNYNVIIIGINTDEDSATDGLAIQWSHDGTHSCDTDVFTISANKGKVFTFSPARRYMRVVYTNGGTDQTSFHMQTIFKKGGFKGSSHRIQDHIVAEDDAELMKAVLTGETPGGTFVNVQTTAAGNLKVGVEEMELESQTPFLLRVAKGEIAGHSIVSKFGQNDDLDTSYQDVWDGTGTYNYPADGTAPITNVESTDDDDDTDLEIQGLDINGDLVIQTVTLTGSTLVTLPTPLWRVFRMKNVGAVDYVGIITAENAGNSITYAIIEVGNNQTLMALYTIPNGKTGYLLQGTNSIVGTNRTYTINGRLTMRQYGGVFQLKKTFGLSADGTSYMVLPHPLPGRIPGKTDIRVSVVSSATGGVNTTFEILLIDD